MSSLRVALENPPERPDLLGTVLSLLSGGLLFIDAATKARLTGWDIAVMCLASGLCMAVVVRFITLRRKRDPFQQAALKYLTALENALTHDDDKDA